ncbi:cytochrome P450 [Melanogaster broomeanus]|nr:cytochrome P450 [Melanogaster broomeanus]
MTFSMALQGAIMVGVLLLLFAYLLGRNFLAKHPLDNIPGPSRQHWYWGNIRQISDPYGWDYLQMLTDRYGHIVKIHGLFGTKLLSVSDPKALHHIVMNEQNIYEIDHGAIAINRIVFGMGLLSTLGDHHRKQRKMLNPVFSINHMRHMVPIFRDIATNLRSAIAEQVKRGPREVNMLEWLSRTALELIGQSGLGYSFDDLKGRENPYSKAVKRLAPALFQMFSAERFLPYLVKIGPPSFRKYIVKNAPWKLVREISSVVDVMDKTCIDVFEAKKKALAEGDEAVVQQVDQGKDIMSILLRENTAASEQDRLSDAELLGQMSTLVFAAMDTTSGALSRILLTLAQHPDVQEKVREEYKQAKAEKGELDYDDLVNLPYLDAVCRETLRLYPPITRTHRTTAEDSVLTFSTTIKGVDGREINEVLVPKNTQVLISILACNRSRELWGEDALEWKPERWLSPLPSTVTGAQIPGVYSHLMTFSGGGKSCIGFKFSQLEMKVVLTTLLESFKFTPTQEIAWTLGLSTPKVKDSKDASYRLPLRVELISDQDG